MASFINDGGGYFYGDDCHWEGEEDQESFVGPPISYKTCKHCGATGLQWGMYKDGWRMFHGEGNYAKLHDCLTRPVEI